MQSIFSVLKLVSYLEDEALISLLMEMFHIFDFTLIHFTLIHKQMCFLNTVIT